MKKLKYVKFFENFGQPNQSIISELKSGKFVMTKNPFDLASLFLAVQQDSSGDLIAVTTSESPSELAGMTFTYHSSVDSSGNVVYELQRI